MKGMALLLVLSAPILFADITGKWSLEDKSHPALFIFKQDGASLTGRVASPAGKEEIPIQNGTVEGDRLKFQDHQGNKDMMLSFDLKASGDEIDGEMQIDDNGKTVAVAVTLKKVPDK